MYVDRASLPLQRARLSSPRPKPCRFVQPFRSEGGLCYAQLQLVESAFASVLDGCLEQCTPGALVSCLHFGRPKESDHASEVSSVELPEDRLLVVVGEGGLDELEGEAPVILGRGRERQRLSFQ